MLATCVPRFSEVLDLMRRSMPDTEVIVQGLYPRGADFDGNKHVWPNQYTFALGLLNSYYEVLLQTPQMPLQTGCYVAPATMHPM